MHYNTIVIGAGPSGLFAAQMIGKKDKKVLLLERNKRLGRKLLVSGSGQCNFTHSGDIKEFFTRYGDNAKFLKKSFSEFDNKKSIEFFQNAGVVTETRENGKVFPKSAKSQEILDVLLLKCQKNNVEIQTEKLVGNVYMHDDLFAVETTDGHRYTSNNVVVATGGKSYEVLGSDGKGYKIAKSFNHKIVETRPALTYVETEEKYFKELSGISFTGIQMTIWRDGKKVTDRIGSLLFTHKGVSGPLILDATRWMKENDTLTFNFIYPTSFEEVRDRFAKEIASRGSEQIYTYLKTLDLPRNFCKLICEQVGIDPETQCAKLSKEHRQKLVDMFTKCPLRVKAIGGFHTAMVTAGGVSLKEVNPTTMESRKQKGLYFVGEVLDIDGDTGGYNIQAAFSTAYVCATHIRNKK
ncbi:MAG: NAD(P)/FAD-dependent oxidoreductase [Cellulosilyticaceae bacterium]